MVMHNLKKFIPKIAVGTYCNFGLQYLERTKSPRPYRVPEKPYTNPSRGVISRGTLHFFTLPLLSLQTILSAVKT